jgi:hypothetical protein
LKVLSVAALAEQVVASSGRIVSVPHTVRHLRSVLPACEHTDEELAQLVSMIAIRRGRNLSFIRS